MKNILLIFGLLWALGASGQIYINSYAFGAGASAGLLLDDYPNAAAAYSLRKLRTAYTGNCIQVRRVSDGTTSNIGFSGNYLDTVALKTFCASTDCFVRTWYDQSTNARNMQQTTNISQPIILQSGAIIYTNGEPSVSFDGTDDFMSAGALSTFITSSTYNFFGVIIPDTIKSDQGTTYSNDAFWADASGFTGFHLRRNANRFLAYNWDGSDDNTSRNIMLDVEYIVHQRHEGGSLVLSVNNDTETSVASGNTTTLTGTVSFARGTAAARADIFVKEAIWWNASQSGNISSIYANINSFYNAY